MTKLSQLTSILNGQIPVVLIYLEKDMPKNFEIARPEEASALLATIEVMLESKKNRGSEQNGKK